MFLVHCLAELRLRLLGGLNPPGLQILQRPGRLSSVQPVDRTDARDTGEERSRLSCCRFALEREQAILAKGETSELALLSDRHLVTGRLLLHFQRSVVPRSVRRAYRLLHAHPDDQSAERQPLRFDLF